MDLSIVIVSWNVKDKLRECLKSIEETMGDKAKLLPAAQHESLALEFEVFVVDNASKDASVEMVKKEFPDVFLIANDFNAGFAKANNQAIRLSQGRYVLLLNPDMRLLDVSPPSGGTPPLGGESQNGTLQGMVKFMDEPRNAKVGVAGCHLVSPKGDKAKLLPAAQHESLALSDFVIVPQVRRFPTFDDQLAIMLKLPHLFPHVLDRYMMSDFDYSKEARVDSIRGSFFMIRREVLNKIGMLDEGFFIWFEEVDFCKRAKEAGYEIAYTPIAKAVDYVGQSFKQIKFYPKQKMFTRSMVYYFKKHAPWWQYRLIWVLRPITLGLVWFGDKLRALKK